MLNHFMFQSQYWQQTLWTRMYARQAGSSDVYSSFVKNILYLWSVCQSLTHLEARSPHKYCCFGEMCLEGKVQSSWAVFRGKSIRKNTFTWRCLDYMRSFYWRQHCHLWLSWPWWGHPLWWARSQSAVPPACSRHSTTVLPSQQTASRCWGSPAVAAAWPALWRKERPVGFIQPTVVKVSAALPGLVRPGHSMLWQGDRGSALKI